MRVPSHRSLGSLVFSLSLVFGAAACGDDGGDGGVDVDAAEQPDAPDNPVDAAPPADAPPMANFECSPLFCEDEMILDLSLHGDKVSAGDVINEIDGTDWVSTIDATAGGFGMSNDNAFLYMRFTENGLEKVAIDDEVALNANNWDIAARRYVVRLNGGTSGGACVGASFQTGQVYGDITEVPVDTVYEYDDFYQNDDCTTMVEDGTGLPGSPSLALTGWWSYVSCVETTLEPVLIELDDGRVVKMVIEAYYGTGQQDCNDTGTPGIDSAMLTARWQFLQ